MKFRNEWKHRITYGDLLVIRQRLQAVARPDSHAGPEGSYVIRSLYFDTPGDKALREKLSGVDEREKFRLRCYNKDFSYIRLEKKSKRHGLCNKQIESVTAEEAARIISGDIGWLSESGRPLLVELYSKMRGEGLRPRTIVEYTRQAFVYGPGNVRVTLDYDLRTGLFSTDFLDPDCLTIPAGEPVVLLEVKWDEFLPGVIRDGVQLGQRRSAPFSKYQACRIYG